MTDEYTPITLDSLAVTPVTVEVETDYGRTFRVRLMPLTVAQWEQVGAEVETPKEPAQKNPATVAAWQAKVSAAEDERSYRRLVRALELGGNPMPGETPAEKVAALKEVADNGVMGCGATCRRDRGRQGARCA